MNSFLICVKYAGAPWAIDGWQADEQEALRRAEELVTKPYMGQATMVYRIDGFEDVPTFTWIQKFEAVQVRRHVSSGRIGLEG